MKCTLFLLYRYAIDRYTDPDGQFAIDGNGLVTTAKHLDREDKPGHRIHILAIDKGLLVLTGYFFCCFYHHCLHLTAIFLVEPHFTFPTCFEREFLGNKWIRFLRVQCLSCYATVLYINNFLDGPYFWPTATHMHHPYPMCEVFLAKLHVLVHRWTTVKPLGPVLSLCEENYWLGRLHHTWLRTVESDLALLNICLAAAIIEHRINKNGACS